MSIYVDNYTVDELTGEVRIIKHLNKKNTDASRGSWNNHKRAKGWNKSGKLARLRNNFGDYNNRRKTVKIAIEKSIEKTNDMKGETTLVAD